MEDKTFFRNYIRQIKREWSQEALLSQSEKIMSLLEMHERFQKAHVILAYYALPDEPCTHCALDRWAESKLVLLPVVKGDHLLLRAYQGRSSLREGAFHILEPIGEVFTDLKAIDLVIVPGVAFDAQRHRLGRGKGYYDKFLSLPGLETVYKLGVCFDFQKLPEVPIEDNDVLMDEVL